MKNILISQRVLIDPLRNETGDILDQRLSSWFYDCGYNPVQVANLPYSKAELLDFFKSTELVGVCISGGNDIGDHQIRDELEVKLIETCLSKSIPIFGICRGMQVIGKYFGVPLVEVGGHVRSRHRLNSAQMREVNSYHRYALSRCPDGFVITETTDDNVIESMSSTTHKIECCMWHPERESPISLDDTQRLRRFFG